MNHLEEIKQHNCNSSCSDLGGEEEQEGGEGEGGEGEGGEGAGRHDGEEGDGEGSS